MKNRFLLIPLLSFLVFQACQETKDEQITQTKQASAVSEKTEGEASKTSEQIEEAVCIWDKSAVRDIEGEKSKWLTSLNLGEKVVYLKETKTAKDGKKDREYHKVKLQDGKEGWVRADFVIPGAKSAAIVSNADVYKRPDLLTKSDKSFSQMDIVAVKNSQNDFIEVVGKRSGETWIETAWIREGNVSYKEVDIAVAKYGKAALAIDNKDEKIKKLREIIENSDFNGSSLIPELKTIADELEFPAEEVVEKVEEEVEDFSGEILEENIEAAP